MAKFIVCISLFFLVVLFPANAKGQSAVSNYKMYLATAKYNNNDVLITRRFSQSGVKKYLAVGLNSLETYVITADKLTVKPTTWEQFFAAYTNVPYSKALQYAKTQSAAMQDAGIIHGYPKEKGITLTIDLCPSHKPLDRVIFTSLVSEFAKTEKPVPVALSLSGRFLLTHLEDIQWLKTLEAKGDVHITWINHTYNHHYDPKVPLEENFLLKPGTDIDFEVLGTEIAMLQNGLLPSIFFRFPGLVSDGKIVDIITGYGLLPVGSDAWLAKGQNANTGSIVLIHGNGNEPIGVKDFIALLSTQRNAVLQKQWLLYDLSESVDAEFKQ